MKKLLAFALVLIFASGIFAAEPVYKLTRIYIDFDAQMIRALQMGLDVVKVEHGEYIEAVTIQRDLDALADAGFRIEILIDDMEEEYLQNRNPNLDTMGGFLTYSEMVDSLYQLYLAAPNIITEPYSIGQSWEGRDLWMVKISDNPNVDENEPEVWYDGMHHAREAIGMELLIYFIRHIVDNYGSDPVVTDMVDTRELFILPIVNPDGYVYNEELSPYGGGMWRKNRRDNGGGIYGVDLNRNYAYEWGYNNIGSSGSPSATDYRGPYPVSEPETQAIVEYINNRHIGISHSYHSHGDWILIPWGSEHNGYTPDHEAFMELGNEFATYNGYIPGPPWETLNYSVNGGSSDWHYGQQDEHYKIMAYSFEVGNWFWPDPSEIEGLCEENLMPNIITAQVADQFQPPSNYIIYAGQEIDDSSGNNNGSADPGEDIGMTITVRNFGTLEATGIEGTLSSTDPYVTVTSAFSTYPDLESLGEGENTNAYEMELSESCPIGHEAEMILDITADGGYNTQLRFDLLIGDPATLPCGPDAFGYMAYDPYDPPLMPQFNWVEICADSGGPGTRVNFTEDDQVFQFALPFTFQYYGQEYDTVTIAANGWLGMGVHTEDDYSNSEIPNYDGPNGMIATYWEDMSPQRTNSGGVWYWYDAANNYYVVEYNHVEQFSPTGNFETFQTILYDPAYYETSTGDGQIKMQYKRMSTASGNEGTYGIESPDETTGIQYLYDGELNETAHSIEDNFAVFYTTPTVTPNLSATLTPNSLPIVIPAGGGSFDCTVELENIGTSPITFDGWITATLPNGSDYEIIVRPNITMGVGGSLLRNITQNVPANAPAGDYTYNLFGGLYGSATVWAEDSFPFSKSGALNTSGGNWNLTGWDDPVSTASDLPTTFSLSQNYPNPFNPETTIRFALPEASQVEISVYNVMGQEVAQLLEGHIDAGYHNVGWNAVDIPSGIYFYKINAGNFTDVKKCVLVK